jgi:hypothetical protein
MSNDPRTEPLIEWNRLARENTENSIVSSMFEASAKASEPIDQFSTWLLLGAAAIASFLIVNSDKIIPLVCNVGYLYCGAFLCLSCIFGLISKMYALRCKIGVEVSSAVRTTFAVHLENYEKEEEKIQESASFWGITLETGIRQERILNEFYKLQPTVIAWYARRLLKKHEGNPQIGHILLVSMLNKQGVFALLQALSFLGFLIVGFGFAAKI